MNEHQTLRVGDRCAHGARDRGRRTSNGCAACSTGSPPTPCTAVSSRRSRTHRVPPCCGSRPSTTGIGMRWSPSTATRSSAVARYDARAGGHAAEIAVTVEDAWQHRGLGKRLTKRLRPAGDRPRNRVVRGHRDARQPTGARPAAPALARRVRAVRLGELRSLDTTSLDDFTSRAAPETTGTRCPPAPDYRAREPFCFGRSASRKTKRSPDQVSSTAHTLLSTSPCASPTSRTMLSRRSVATPAVRFGHAIHSPPFAVDRARQRIEATLELGQSRREEHHDVVLTARLMTETRAVRHRIQCAVESFGSAYECNARAGLDTQLLRQRSPRIPRHEVQSIARDRWGQSESAHRLAPARKHVRGARVGHCALSKRVWSQTSRARAPFVRRSSFLGWCCPTRRQPASAIEGSW